MSATTLSGSIWSHTCRVRFSRTGSSVAWPRRASSGRTGLSALVPPLTSPLLWVRGEKRMWTRWGTQERPRETVVQWLFLPQPYMTMCVCGSIKPLTLHGSPEPSAQSPTPWLGPKGPLCPFSLPPPQSYLCLLPHWANLSFTIWDQRMERINYNVLYQTSRNTPLTTATVAYTPSIRASWLIH